MMDNQAQSMMWLRRLSVTNYRKFGGRFGADANSNGGHSDSMVPGLTVDFDRQMTVLVGENGAGKTAVLDAAAVALGTFLESVSSRFRIADSRERCAPANIIHNTGKPISKSSFPSVSMRKRTSRSRCSGEQCRNEGIRLLFLSNGDGN